MITATVTSRQLSQSLGQVKQAAKSGPVVITDHGKPTHVLLCIEEYRRLTGQGLSLIEALSMPGLSDIEFDPPRVQIGMSPPDLS